MCISAICDRCGANVSPGKGDAVFISLEVVPAEVVNGTFVPDCCSGDLPELLISGFACTSCVDELRKVVGVYGLRQNQEDEKIEQAIVDNLPNTGKT